MDIFFEKGIPGLESYKNFSIHKVQENEKFSVIISKEDSNIGFLSISPFEVKNDYEINLSDEIIKELDIKKPENVLVLGIITLGKILKESTINLKAPIIINIENNKGSQLILQDEKYKIKEPLE